MKACLACRMGQHHECEAHFIEQGSSHTCECLQCATKTESAKPAPENRAPNTVALPLPEAELTASGQLNSLANYVSD